MPIQSQPHVSDPMEVDAESSCSKDSPDSSATNPDNKSFRYVPCWTDPEWEDEGPKRQSSDAPISSAIADQLRPAILRRDAVKNPTVYAQRFGIFPKRTDGRSRTSPTRTTARRGTPFGPAVRGQVFYDELENWAAARAPGQHVEDAMADQRPDLAALNDRDRQIMEVYQELRTDEYWQGALFAGMTMDELEAGDHFSMADSEMTLTGEIHPLLSRDQWKSSTGTLPAGSDPKPSKFIIGDQAPELMDPRTNDLVWAAMRPSLLLATKILESNDPFFRAVADITNRRLSKRPDDNRDEARKRGGPIREIVTWPNAHEVVGARAGFKPSRDFDSAAISFRALSECLELRLGSGRHWLRKKPSDYSVGMGCTYMSLDLSRDGPIVILTEAELVWFLLEPKFSQSEKAMASYILAMTLVHELMHALEMVAFRWTSSWPSYCPTNPQDIAYCKQIRQEMWPRKAFVGESYYENDEVEELGHAFEAHVMGGGIWPMGPMAAALRPRFLAYQCSMGFIWKYPDAMTSLGGPNVLEDCFGYLIRHSVVRQYFRQEFWDNAVRRHGMAAVRFHDHAPSKAAFSQVSTSSFKSVLANLSFGTDEDRHFIADYLHELSETGRVILRNYIKALIVDAHGFEMMVLRFVAHARSWKRRGESLQWAASHISMVRWEALVYAAQQSRVSRNAPSFEMFAHEWKREYDSIDGPRLPDDHSIPFLKSLSDFRQPASQVADRFQDRMQTLVMNLCTKVWREQQVQEAMVCELYQLPPESWKHYHEGIPGHQDAWVAHNASCLISLYKVMNALKMLGNVMPWCKDLEVRVFSLVGALDQINRLIASDGNVVHRNWRDYLISVPFLRKVRAKPFEKWYFLAKREMLNLKPQEMRRLRRFKARFKDMLNLGSYKIVLPSTDKENQGIAECWAGLLDGALDNMYHKPDLTRPPSDAKIAEYIDTIQQEKAEETTMQGWRAFAFTQRSQAEFREHLEQRSARQRHGHLSQARSLQDIAQYKSFIVSGIEPKITDPEIEDHPMPFGESLCRPHHSASTSHSGNHWEAQQPRVYTAEMLAYEANMPCSNKFGPSGRTGRVIPRKYLIKRDITKVLKQGVAQKLRRFHNANAAAAIGPHYHGTGPSQDPSSGYHKARTEKDQVHIERLTRAGKRQKAAHAAARRERARPMHPEPQDGAALLEALEAAADGGIISGSRTEGFYNPCRKRLGADFGDRERKRKKTG